MTATTMSTTSTVLRGERMPIITLVASMTTVVLGTALTLAPTAVPAHLGVSPDYQILAGLVLMLGALLGAVSGRVGFVLGGYVYNTVLVGAIAFGLHEFQDGATFALLDVMFSALLALVTSIILIDVRRQHQA